MPRSGSASSASRPNARRRWRRCDARCRSSATSWARGCGSSASRTSTSTSTTRPNVAPGSSSCSASWRPGRCRTRTRRSANRSRRRSPGCRTSATWPRSRRRPSGRRCRGGVVATTFDPAPDRRSATDRTVTVDLDPFLAAVPDAVVSAAGRGPTRAGGQPREPGRRHDRSGPRPSRAWSRRVAARPTCCARTRSRPCTGSCPGSNDSERIRTRLPTTTWRSSSTAGRSSGSATWAFATRSCSSACRGWSSTITPRTMPAGKPTGSIRRPRRRARW